MLLRLITTTALIHIVIIASFGIAVGAFAFYHIGRR